MKSEIVPFSLSIYTDDMFQNLTMQDRPFYLENKDRSTQDFIRVIFLCAERPTQFKIE